MYTTGISMTQLELVQKNRKATVATTSERV
jgi:hypothetical protein